MAYEDARRNAKNDIENDIRNYLKEKQNKASYDRAIHKIDLAAKVNLLHHEEIEAYLAQLV